MATYFVWSGAGGAATGADWANAFLTVGPAMAAATTNGDIIKMHVGHTEVCTTITFAANAALIVVDKDASDAYTPMTSGGLTVTGATSGTLNGAFNVFVAGLRWVSAATGTGRFLSIGASDGLHGVFLDCTFGFSSVASNGLVRLGGGADQQVFVSLTNCTFTFGAGSQYILAASKCELYGCSLAGTALTDKVFLLSSTDPGGAELLAIGCDFSSAGSAPLASNSTALASTLKLVQCKLGTGFVLLETQTNLNRSSCEVYALDCSSGDTHGLFGFANSFGSVVSDTGIYFTSSPNSVMTGTTATPSSWKIATTPYCSYYTPFTTPWFGYYNEVTTAITPYVEILRDGSSTAYQDDEVWLDVMAKTNSGSTQSALTTGRMTLLGTPANQAAGAGLGSWTGESGTAWSGKLAVASLTPAEVGDVQVRISVGEPSTTVYVDPYIRT